MRRDMRRDMVSRGIGVCVVLYSILCILVLGVPCVSAYYIPLVDTKDVYPLLVSSDTNSVVGWTSGYVAQLRSRSNGIRVSDRGIRFVSVYSPLRLSGRIGSNHSGHMHVNTRVQGHEWGGYSTTCFVGPGRLCTTATGAAVFPDTKELVLISGAPVDISDSFMWFLNEMDCTMHSGRTVKTDITEYTVSLCDITQKHNEFVYTQGSQKYAIRNHRATGNTDETINTGNTTYNTTYYILGRMRRESTLFYVVFSLSCIILVTCLAQNISQLLKSANKPPSKPSSKTSSKPPSKPSSKPSNKPPSKPSSKPPSKPSSKPPSKPSSKPVDDVRGVGRGDVSPVLSLTACVTLVLVVLVPPFTSDSYVTTSDMLYHWFVFAYTVYGVIVWSIRRWVSADSWLHNQDSVCAGDTGVPFNVMISTLLLGLCRLYDGIESDYVLPLLFLLLVRAIHKIQIVFAFTLLVSPSNTPETTSVDGTYLECYDPGRIPLNTLLSHQDTLHVDQKFTGNICTDNIQTGNTCIDSIHTDNTLTDNIQTDNTLTDNIRTDNIHTDNTHTDNTHTDNLHVARGDLTRTKSAHNKVVNFHVIDEESCILMGVSRRHPWLGVAYRYTLPLDWILIALTHQYGFKPLFFNSGDGDVYFVVVAAFAVVASLMLRDTQLRFVVQSSG